MANDFLTHAELEELLGAYAVDAVDPDERDAVDRHLADCPRCRAEVAEHREVVALLAHTGATAPDGLWDRIAGAIEGAGEPTPDIRIDLADARRDRRPSRPSGVPGQRWLAAAAAVVAFALIGLLAWQNQQLSSDVDAMRADRSIEAAATQALGEPGARIAQLRSDDGAAQAVVVVRPDGQGYIVGKGLPALDDDLYQLWGASPGGDPVSLGVLGGSPDVVAFHADPNVKTVMVSREDEPVQRPTGDLVVAGDLT